MKDNVQMDASMAKRLWHMIRTAYYMLLKGFCKHKLILDLHLLLKRGKLAGKAIGDFLTFHHHHHHHIGSHDYSAFSSCRPTDPALSFYSSNDVEFSCSNTPDPYPASSFLTAAKRKHRRRQDSYDADVAAAMVRALETLSGETSSSSSPSFQTAAATPSPSAPAWGLGVSPAAVRPLRVTDSPFPVREDGDGGRVDRQAEAFIKRFYEQLRLQQSLPVTPEYCRSRRRKPA